MMNADYVWKLSKFGRLTSTRLRFDDDFADRLNYQLTGLLLFVFVGIIGIRQYVGKPIHCWTPQEFTRSWEEYAENYCWVASTYFIHYHTHPGPPPPPPIIYQREGSISPAGYLVPVGYRFAASPTIQPAMQPGQPVPRGRYINYYQWAPILLAVQSFLFYLPCLVWRLFSSQSGFQLRRIMQLASEAALAAPTEADAAAQPANPTPTSAGAPMGMEASKAGSNSWARLSMHNQTSLLEQQQSNWNNNTPSFVPTKSVRTLARYLDMCLMRQRELRLADVLSRICVDEDGGMATTPTPPPPPPRAVRPSSSFRIREPRLSTIHQEHLTSTTGGSRESSLDENMNKLSDSMKPPVIIQLPHSMNRSDHKSASGLWKPDPTTSSGCLNWLCGTPFSCCTRHPVGGTSYRTPRGRRRPKSIRPISDGTDQMDIRMSNCYGPSPSSGGGGVIGVHENAKQTSLGDFMFSSPVRMKPRKHRSWKSRTVTPITGRQQQQQHQQRHWSCVCCSRHQGNCLVRLHMFVKLLYLSNTVGQICLLEYYTGVQYTFYGIRVLYDLIRGRQWEESGHFPRVTFCDFEARKMAQSHYYTLQCVLPINMFLEKIYIFLWLWFFVVSLVTFASLLIWILRIGTSRSRYHWIRHQLITIRQFNRPPEYCRQFVENHLGPDAVFILRLIAQNYGDLVAGDTVGELWNAYWSRRQVSGPSNPGQTLDRRMSDRSLEQSIGLRQTTPGPPVRRTRDRNHRLRPVLRSPSGQHPVTHPKSISPIPPTDSLTNTPQKERYKRFPTQTGYSATMMATEMIHPSDRFAAVPLLTDTRRAPSVHSRESSRDSRDSRERDRSVSPPPIPQRSSDGDSSRSDRRSMHDFGGMSDMHSLSSQHDHVTPPAQVDDDAERQQFAQPDEDQFDTRDTRDDTDRDISAEFDAVEIEMGQQDYQSYQDEYLEQDQHDDHIV